MMAAPWAVPARPAPRSGFHLEFRPAPHAGALGWWLAVPARLDPAARPLVAVHGIRRGAEQQAALFGARAATLGRPVIAPLFDAQNWPTYQRLGGQADLALLSLLQQLHGDRIGPPGRFDLFGFSGGAQFAHRFAMLHPHRIGRLSVAAAGWYTFPDVAAYPYGLGACAGLAHGIGPRMHATLDAFLRLPIQVCVGANDKVRDPNTRTGAAIDRQQGRNRRERASRWSEALAIAAAVRGIVPRVGLSVLPGVGHDFRRCAQRGGLAELVLSSPTDDVPWQPWRAPLGAGEFASRRAVVHSMAAAAC
jgi:pimeloyl-ACP methyl ester carboxylesterase